MILKRLRKLLAMHRISFDGCCMCRRRVSPSGYETIHLTPSKSLLGTSKNLKFLEIPYYFFTFRLIPFCRYFPSSILCISTSAVAHRAIKSAAYMQPIAQMEAQPDTKAMPNWTEKLRSVLTIRTGYDTF